MRPLLFLLPVLMALFAAFAPRNAQAHLPVQLFQGAEHYQTGVIVKLPPGFDPEAFPRMPDGLYQNPPQFPLEVELLTGGYRGATVTVDHLLSGNPAVDVVPSIGEQVIVAETRMTDGTMNYRVIDYDRRSTLAWMSAFSGLALLLIGRNGLKALAFLIAAGAALYGIGLSLLINGAPPILVGGISALALGMGAIRLALRKHSTEGLAAMLGLGTGIVVTIAVMAIAFHTGHVSGIATPDALVLYAQVKEARHLDFRQLWLAGALLTTLGGLVVASLLTARAMMQVPDADPWKVGIQEGGKFLPAIAAGTFLLYFGYSLSLLLIAHLGDVTPIQISMVRLFNYDYLVSVILAWEGGLIGLVATLIATSWFGKLLRRRASA